MPRVIIQATVGRSVEQKRELVRRLTDLMVEVFSADRDNVTVFIEEAQPENAARGGLLVLDGGGRSKSKLAD
jgi:4-oxalocrotonate tautomerase